MRVRRLYSRPVPPIRPVVLSGGSGTRLWPLSTAEVPKQFSPLFGKRSLFGLTLDRLAGIPDLQSAIVVTGHRHVDLVSAEFESASAEAASIEVGPILVEPTGRNTAPAALAAALTASPDDVLVILPSDHLISDVEEFQRAVAVASDLAQGGSIVTFGIRPTRPETGYGYIEMGEDTGGAHEVVRFKEKPDFREANELVGDGRHLWNSGIFVVRGDRLIEEAANLCPDVLDGVRAALPSEHSGVVPLDESFESVKAISFDHAIMEQTDRALVVPVDIGWSDVGSYQSLLEVSDRDDAGNHVTGDVILSGVTRSYIRSTSRPLVVAGLDDVVVVETPDAVLVLPLNRAQEVKDLQARVDEG